MAFDTKELADLMNAEGYPVMFEAYDSVPTVRERVGIVHDVTDENIHGTKGTVIGTLGRPKEVAHGQEIPADQIKKAHVWYERTKKYGARLDLTEEDMRSAKKVGNLVTSFAQQWGRQFALLKEEISANVFLRGTLTAGSLDSFDGSFLDEVDPHPKFIYDGLPYFDTAHADNVAGTTYSNINATNSLTQANLQAALTQLNYTNAKDSRNARFLQRANTLLVPSALRFTAVELLKSELKPGSANNDINSTMDAVEPVVWDFLTDTDAWYLGDTDQPFGFEMYDSGAPVMRLAFDEKTQTHSIIVVTYFGTTVTNWRNWLSNNKAAA